MDVVIIYERKLRELENAILLKLALEKRGLECEVRQFYEVNSFIIRTNNKPKIIVTPHLYITKSIPRIFARFGKSSYVINLQYEQVLSEKWEKLGHHNPKGEAKKAYHICWGDSTRNRLIDCGIDEGNVKVFGALHLDMLRNEYRSRYFISKEIYAYKYNIPYDKKWTLFISSFTYADISVERLKMNEEVANTDLMSFVTIHTDSRNKILEWFNNVLISDNENIFIYRPHPDELTIDTVLELEKKYDNFIVISEESVKNWISVTDKIYSWYSTSIVEAHFLNKAYSILRPTELPIDFDSVLLKQAKFIETYDEFLENYTTDCQSEMPIEDVFINQYYQFKHSKASFEQHADFVLELTNSNGKQNFNIGILGNFKAKITALLVWGVYTIYRLANFDLKRYRTRSNNNFLIRWLIEMDNQIATEDEKEAIEERLKDVLNY